MPIMQAGESESNTPAVNTMNPVNVSSHKNVNIYYIFRGPIYLTIGPGECAGLVRAYFT